jgi:hypothetical protein
MKNCLLLVLACMISGCASSKPEKTSLELQAFQAHEFETSKKVAFAAVLSVFQDFGYVISSAEINTGFITAKSPTKGARVLFVGSVMQESKATAFVEEMPGDKVRVRLNFVGSKRTSSKRGRIKENEVAIEDPLPYQKAFEKIDEAIFIRKGTK